MHKRTALQSLALAVALGWTGAALAQDVAAGLDALGQLRRRLRRRHRQEKGVLIKLKKEKGPLGLSFFCA